jgi:hypothetical protein
LKTKAETADAEIEKWKTKAKAWEKETKKTIAEKEELEKGIESRSLKRLITNPPFMKLVQRGGASSASASSAHSKATVHEAEFEIALQPKTNEDGTKSFEFNDVTKFNDLIKIMTSRSSSLLLRFSEPNECEGEVYCEFWNEADISALIQTALVDATYLAHCVTGKQFAIRNECSIFSLRPDHFVVLGDGVPLLAVADGSQGWTKAGTRRFNELTEIVKESRERSQRIALEQRIKDSYVIRRSRGGGGSSDDDDDSEDESDDEPVYVCTGIPI